MGKRRMRLVTFRIERGEAEPEHASREGRGVCFSSVHALINRSAAIVVRLDCSEPREPRTLDLP